MSSSPTPPALAALAAFPHLRAQCARALAAQAVRVAERSAQALAQPALTAALDQQISLAGGRLIALEAAPGQGLTTLICRLATERPYAFWLPHDDAGEGLAVLCAQALALAQLLPRAAAAGRRPRLYCTLGQPPERGRGAPPRRRPAGGADWPPPRRPAGRAAGATFRRSIPARRGAGTGLCARRAAAVAGPGAATRRRWTRQPTRSWRRRP